MGSGVRRGAGWGVRGMVVAAELALLVTAVGVVQTSDGDTELALLFLWDVLALSYLLVGMAVVRHQALHPHAHAPHADHALLQRWVGVYLAVFPAVISLMGLSAAAAVILQSSGSRGASTSGISETAVLKGAAAVAMVLAWLVLHVSYGRLYRWGYARDGGGLEFPGDAPVPTGVDFFYFAVTLGATFATSDVNVTTSRMRWRVMVHSIVSFFYNTVVLAVGVRIITGG